MEEQIKSPKGIKTNHILIVLVIALIGVLGYLVLTKKELKEGEVKIDELTIEKAMLARDFQDLALDYDSLNTNNDTISKLLSKERERIAMLIEEIKTIKSANSAQIGEYKKELSSLRNIMRNFVMQIDSLNARNKVLSTENQVVKQQYTKIKDSFQELEKEKNTLVDKVEIASKLELKSLECMALNSRGKETNRTTKTEKIRVCFTLMKNVTAPVGMKSVYLRLMRPDESLLVKSMDDLFAFEGSKINFSATRSVEYGGADLDVCLFYNAVEGELIDGNYVADIFCDGKHIGTSSFTLK